VDNISAVLPLQEVNHHQVVVKEAEARPQADNKSAAWELPPTKAVSAISPVDNISVA
jgi:hypothetical protein